MIIPTNTLDLILQVARTQGCAPPEEIRMRPEVRDRIHREDGTPTRLELCGIPIKVDPSIPAFPGFEIHRERW